VSGGARQSARLGDRPASDPPSAEDAARVAGRGFVLITGAKIVFMVMGTTVTIGMPLLGMTQDQFGDYNTIIAAVSVLNMVVITGTIQAVGKMVSEKPNAAAHVVRQATLLQMFFGVPIVVAYITAAPWIADALGDPSLTTLLRVSGVITLAYAFYAIFVGYFNGKKAFGLQAALDATFSTTKAGLMLGLVVAGLGVAGAIAGFSAAAVLIVVVSCTLFLAHLRRHPAPERSPGTARLAGYLLTVMFYTFCIYGVLRTDLFVLRGVSAVAGSPETGAVVAGIYGGIQYMARLPFQAVIAVTFVVFPLISSATFANDLESTRSYIRATLRYSLILTVLLSALVAGNAAELVTGLYGADYASGIGPLRVLTIATVGYALFYIATTMITGAGHPVASAAIAFVTLGITAGANYALVTAGASAGVTSEGIMMRGALATTASMFVGFALSASYLLWRFRAGIRWETVVRVTVAGVIVIALCTWTSLPASVGRVWQIVAVLGKGIVGSALFVGILVITLEVGREDMGRLRRMLVRKTS
jgi:O-antigen/teichoic acid export membrane protein